MSEVKVAMDREDKVLGKGLMFGFRALDLTNAQGYVCGKLLANLGVDVIKIERPGGDPDRWRAPYIDGETNPEKSIYWNSFNADKRGITLNLECDEGKELFLQLVKTADFVLESFEPGYMDKLGIGYAKMSEINPRIILTSITPFGQTGSHSHFRGGELICSAMGATMDNIGDPDRAPLLEPADTNTFYANCLALTGTMVAHYARECSGEGQQVDVSIEEAAANRNPQGQVAWAFNRKLIKRMGPFSKYGSAKVRTIWECKDGFVNWTMFAGALGFKANSALCKWMNEDGLENPLNVVEDWKNFDMSAVSAEEMAYWETCMARFFKKHTKEEFRTEGSRRKLAATVLDCPDDLWQNEHLRVREYWKDVEVPGCDKALPMTNFFLLSSETENYTHTHAPRIGEHNEEIYQTELALGGRMESLWLFRQRRSSTFRWA